MIEQWIDLPGFEKHYQVSSFGNVRGLDRFVSNGNREGNHFVRGQLLRLHVNHHGYKYVTLGFDRKRSVKEVHALIALAFLGSRPEGFHAHHIDESKLNNRIDNLEYKPSEKHHQHHHEGERCHKAVLTNEQIGEVRNLLNGGMIQKDVAKIFGVSRSTIGEIHRGATWKHIT